MQRDVSHLFNHFAGKEFPMREMAAKPPHKGQHVAPENPQHPLIADMQQEAEKHGLKLRLCWPGKVMTRDLRADRVNAHVVKAADGTWRIGSTFNIG